MTPETIRQIGVYLDEIADLARTIAPSKLGEVKARCELIKAAVGATMESDTDTGTGQQLKDYLPFWDRSYEDIEADGPSEIEISAVKNALANGGFTLKFPAKPDSGGHWRKWNPGDPI